MYRAAFIITLLLCGCGHGKEDKAKVKLVYVYRRDDAVRRCSSTVGQPKGAESRRERKEREGWWSEGKEKRGGKRERGGREAWREDLHSWNKLQRTMEGDRHVEGIQIKEVEDIKKSMRPSELLRPSGVTFDPARATIMIISRDIDNIKNVSSPLRNEISSRMCLSFRHARMLHENINIA